MTEAPMGAAPVGPVGAAEPTVVPLSTPVSAVLVYSVAGTLSMLTTVVVVGGISKEVPLPTVLGVGAGTEAPLLSPSGCP